MNSRERVLAALQHRQPDRIPVDLGGSPTSGLHVSCVAALRDHYGLEKRPVKVYEPYQLLGWIDEDLKRAMELDVEAAPGRGTMFGFPIEDWKPWRTQQGLEVLVPGRFNTKVDSKGDVLMYPEGDTSAPPSARMPKGGYFFDAIIRQEPIVEEELDPADNLEEFKPISDADLAHYAREAKRAAATGRAVMSGLPGTNLGDIAQVPAVFLKRPKGIRDITEWYISTKARKDYVRTVFERQTDIALENLEKIRRAVGDLFDAVWVCGTDFGTQTSSFCSVETYRDLYLPYYKKVNDWVHSHTRWKTWKHSCGAVEKFIPSFIECGFDILNPVQCSAAGMDPAILKERYGKRIVFWGGGVDTQKVLPFGTPAEVRAQVEERCRVFSPGGGFVFNAIHNIQANTPVENIVAMLEAVRKFRG